MASMSGRRLLGMGFQDLRSMCVLPNSVNNWQSKRTIFAMLDAAWNKVDDDRIKEVGADKAAAEWLMRCGASLKWRGGRGFVSDYNEMEMSSGRNTKIEGIDASGSCIMSEGFAYLAGLSDVKSVKLDKTHHVDNSALGKLEYLKNSLEELQISSCGNVTDSGLKLLTNLHHLKKLTLLDLPGVKKPSECLTALKSALPQCQIEFDGGSQ